MRYVYADNAATTKPDPKVITAMLPYLTNEYGNPSSLYSIGRSAKEAVEKARKQTAAVLNASNDEIYFTSSGSESDNWAIISAATAYRNKGRHIITSKIEHPAVLETLNALKGAGYEITYIGIDENGFICLDELKNAIRKDTILISVMFANNEIGVIQPVAEIGQIAKESGVVFHTDAVQAAGHEIIDVNTMNIDMLSLSGHKIYGPKGTGALYIKKSIKRTSYINGGNQERGKRAGTENVAGIVGLGAATEKAAAVMVDEKVRILKLRDKLIDGILTNIADCRLNGDRDKRLSGNVNISFGGILGESLVIMLDQYGIAMSSGSACTAGSHEASHVISALGYSQAAALGAVRISLGADNTEDDIDYILDVLPKAVTRLREMSPII